MRVKLVKSRFGLDNNHLIFKFYFNKGASPKKTAKIRTYVKFSLPYLPSKPIWTEKNMDVGLIFLSTYLPKKYGHIPE